MTSPTAPGRTVAFTFPVTLAVAGRRCVVVGGGPLARERADALRAADADVVELAPDAFDEAALDGALLLLVSGEDGTDPAVALAAAERRGVLVNTLDDVAHCHFAFPALVRRGDLAIAVSTGGKAPALARRVRLDLEEHLPESLATLVEAYADAREQLLPRTVPFDAWASGWRTALDDLDGLLALCEHGEADRVRDHLVATVAATVAAHATTGSS